MLIRNRFFPAFAFFIAMLCAGAPPAQSQVRPALETFAQPPAITTAQLSPNGRFIALGMTPKGGRTRLVVVDVKDMAAAKVIAAPTDADVARVEWVSDDRLVFNLTDGETAAGDQYQGAGLYAVQRDGSDFRVLIRRRDTTEHLVTTRVLDPMHSLFAPTRTKNSDDVFVTQGLLNVHREVDSLNLLRLNTKTGQAVAFNRPGKVIHWVVDPSDTPRAVSTYEEGIVALHVLEREGQWRKVTEYSPFSPMQPERLMEPFGFAPDGAMYVTALNGDKRALYRYHPETNKRDAEPVVSTPDNDFTGQFVMDDGKVLGIRYLTDARATVWLDEGMKKMQAAVDKLLPGNVNLIDVPLRAQTPLVLVASYSDVKPINYLLFDTATGKLTLLGSSMYDVDPRQMARQDLVRYPARDGLTIPAWLTLPPGGKGKKLPMVVLVHGGPWVRGGEWGWSAERQFLASRGYAVLEPEFRGSLGWGYQHFRKSFRQWGQAMQGDIADGARWAIAQGIADPSRICIGGGSYGGYSALMGLINDPDLFRCGFAAAAVTDLEMLYTVLWSDFSLVYKTYGLPVLVGDRVKDAEQLKKNSPLQQAARLKQPLLLVHGGADKRVPIVHATRLRDALQQTNKDVEWVEYTEEGHGWILMKNRLDYFTRLERFLDKHIGSSQ